MHSYQYPATQNNGECYNPNEAGSYTDTGISSSTDLISMTASGSAITTQANIAFYAQPGVPTTTCASPYNTTVLSGVILNKTVTLGFNANIPQAIEYNVSLKIPSSYNPTYCEVNSLEYVAWYLQNNGTFPFDTFLQNNPVTGVNTNVTSQAESQTSLVQANYPAILSYGNADFAAGLYCPTVEPSVNINYLQGYIKNPNKLGIVAYLNVISPTETPTFSLTFYLLIGSLADVNSGLAALIAAYPPPVPNISYAFDNYTFVNDENIPNLIPTNVGGPLSSYSISPNLTANTGLTFNSETGEISGTASKLSAATNYAVTAIGPGGSGRAYDIEIAVVIAVSFTIDNRSNNSLSYSFYGIDGTTGQISGGSEANSGVSAPIAVPTGTYQVVISPAGTPVNCDMIFNTGEAAYDTPGYTFSPIDVSNSGTDYLTVTNP